MGWAGNRPNKREVQEEEKPETVKKVRDRGEESITGNDFHIYNKVFSDISENNCFKNLYFIFEVPNLFFSDENPNPSSFSSTSIHFLFPPPFPSPFILLPRLFTSSSS